jgi:hypothetical protein
MVLLNKNTLLLIKGVINMSINPRNFDKTDVNSSLQMFQEVAKSLTSNAKGHKYVQITDGYAAVTSLRNERSSLEEINKYAQNLLRSSHLSSDKRIELNNNFNIIINHFEKKYTSYWTSVSAKIFKFIFANQAFFMEHKQLSQISDYRQIFKNINSELDKKEGKTETTAGALNVEEHLRQELSEVHQLIDQLPGLAKIENGNDVQDIMQKNSKHTEKMKNLSQKKAEIKAALHFVDQLNQQHPNQQATIRHILNTVYPLSAACEQLEKRASIWREYGL